VNAEASHEAGSDAHAVHARHLVLVGMMGSGKTTVGRLCAQRLGRPLIDTDAQVEAAAARTVSDIFATAGEAAFRALERDAVAAACAHAEPAVIACGGGAVLDETNRGRLRAAGLVVWLRTAPATLAARIPADGERPLLAGATGEGAQERVLAELAARRADAYTAAAHVTVDTDGLDAGAVADRVVEEFAACVG
jgi:shikimate kinase